MIYVLGHRNTELEDLRGSPKPYRYAESPLTPKQRE